MINHMVFWNFNVEMSEAEKREAGIQIKRELTALKGQIEGLIELDVSFEPMKSSNRELALFSTFSSQETLEAYQKHPKHISASVFLKSVTCDRICFDYTV